MESSIDYGLVDKNEESAVEIFDPELWDDDMVETDRSIIEPDVNVSNDPDKGANLLERDVEKLQIEVANLRSR
jgi:hypothetical protein